MVPPMDCLWHDHIMPHSAPSAPINMSKKYRLCINPKDVALVLDLSPRQAQRKYQQAKDAYGKAKHQQLTIHEFAAYYDLPLAEIIERL